MQFTDAPFLAASTESRGRRSVLQPDGRTVTAAKSIDRTQICVTAVFAAHALLTAATRVPS